MIPNPDHAVSIYHQAKEFVSSAGYLDELSWQETRNVETLTEKEFLCEIAWVIFCSGFKEATVRRYFDFLSLCFCDWEAASLLVEKSEICIQAAIPVFRNMKKLEAVIRAAEIIDANGFQYIHAEIQSEPIQTLKRFPFIGDITSWHLAKNIGFQVAKPDRHLVRFSEKTGYACVQEFCHAISKITGDTINIVDLTLWRYAASGLKRTH